MNLDNFKSHWQQRQRDLDQRVDHVVHAVRSRMSSFDRTIWLRDMQEAGAAVLLFVWYGYSLLTPSNWLATCGTLIGMLACVFIVTMMHLARKKDRRDARPSLALEDYCKAELKRVDRQIWLLRNVHWWYLSPLFIGMVVQYISLGPTFGKMLSFLISSGALFGLIYRLNQRAVKNRLMPLRQDLIDATNVEVDGLENKDDSAAEDKFNLRRSTLTIGVLLAGAIAIAYFSQHVDVVGWDPEELPAETVAGLAIDDKLRARLVGRYQLTPDFIFDVEERDGRLMVGITDQSTQEVFPDSPTHWSYRSVEATLEFKLPSSGPAKRLILHQNGFRQSAIRIDE